MSRRTVWAGWVIGAAWLAGAPAFAQTPREASAAVTPSIPLDDLSAEARTRVRSVIDQPTLKTTGRAETFVCQPAVYDWLLDHPDLTVRLWRLLGAKCGDISPDGRDSFVWKDGASHVHWDTMLKRPGLRVWYADGVIHPGLFLPTVPVRAVAVLRYSDAKNGEDRPALRHQVELTIHTDSHAAALVARVLGASAPRAGEQMVGQIEMFYAAMAWYLEQHPRHAEALFAQLRRPASTDTPMKPSSKSGS